MLLSNEKCSDNIRPIMMEKTVSPNWTIVPKLMMVTIAFGFCVTIFSPQPTFAGKVRDVSVNERSERSPQMLAKERVRRAIVCTLVFITPDKTDNFLLPSMYSATNLETCLNNSVLAANLTELGNLAFTTEQLVVIKRKLGEIYPGTLPQEEIKKLGLIITVYTIEDVSQWKITDPDVVAAAIENSGTAEAINVLKSHYLKGPGVLNATALNAIGGTTLCTATEERLKTIPPTEFRKAKPLDISTCTQARKDIIFGIAKVAFQDQAGDPHAYYNLTRPYVGGARASDLQRLAARRVNMDFETFKGLNPPEVEKLTALSIRDLLGRNLNALKENENQEIVQRWVNSHTMDEVMSLRIGLQGGILPAEVGIFSFKYFAKVSSSASVKSSSVLLSTCVAVMGITMYYLR
ncbi:mesothelin-like protein isoform X1 [Scyliorhinus canicula]|uniref:mesothelin-like protein isoform X1 n=2 Tax=Scyliorhinus canicula TaxID=7830 RepID=UPI0018F7247C|nr:mesothelin-like protein isoform X1 [Scyliorhinus canicula]